MKNKLCIAVPIKTAKFEVNIKLLKQIIKEKPDFIELRFDYIDDINLITTSFLEKFLSLTNIPMIFTLRSNREGGHLELNNTQRLPILQRLIEAKPGYIDIEMLSPIDLLQEVIDLCTNRRIKIIFSYHNFQSTVPLHEAQILIENFKSKLQNIVQDEEDILKTFIFKLIFTATQFEDNLIPLQLCDNFYSQGYKIISFCMGELGIFSRILCIKKGSLFTYAALEETTAPGQLKITTMRNFLSLL
jgi:3-dehydroquinate dehydratase type I